MVDEYYFERYIKFIDYAVTRFELPEGIIEKHHIVPKCYLPSYMTLTETFKKNMAILSSHEHYVAHYLLARAFGGKMVSAFKRMSYNSKYNTAKLPINEDASDILG